MLHRPVMLTEAVDALRIRQDGCYVDCTYGRGGHAQEILARLGPDGSLVVFDKDPDALRHAQENLGLDARVTVMKGSFTGVGGLQGVDGVLFDLGVSSALLEDPSRGFGFRQDGPLDMRYDPSVGVSAAEWLRQAGEAEIADVLWRYGEERAAAKIARALVTERPTQTRHLAALISRLVGKRRRHPATKCFLALRLFINRELEELVAALRLVPDVLVAEGRLVVIAFHSLEDRVVKQFMRERMQMVSKSRAGRLEVAANPRARSAIMRVATL